MDGLTWALCINSLGIYERYIYFVCLEKRRKFDEGEDPLDPEQQQQGGGPFWHEGFNPFGGSGFKFKFNFN